MKKKLHFQPLQIYKSSNIIDSEPFTVYMKLHHNNHIYTLKILFSKHATERLFLRCFSQDEVLNIIQKSFSFILSDAHINKNLSSEKRMKTLILIPDKCKLILMANVRHKREIDISIITVLLDYQRPYDYFKKKDTLVHYLQYCPSD